MKKKIFIGAIIILLAIIVVKFVKKDDKRIKNNVYVKVDSIVKKDIEEIVKAKGKVDAKEVKELYSSIVQKVKEVKYKIGDRVEKNDTLILFDNNEKERLLNEIKLLNLDIENEKINLKLLKKDINNIEILQKKYEIETKEKNLENLEMNLELLEKQKKAFSIKYDTFIKNLKEKEELFKDGGLSKDELTELRNQKIDLENEMAAKDYEIYNKNQEIENRKLEIELYKKIYDIIIKNYNTDLEKRENNIKITENNLKKYNIQLKEKEKNLEKIKGKLISPFDGVILSIRAEKNMLTDTEKPLIVLANTTNMIIKTDVPTYDIGKIKIGDMVRIKTDILENGYYNGKITKISNIAEQKQEQGYIETVVGIEILVIDKDTKLKPGYDVDIEIITNKSKNTLIVPSIDIVYDNNKKYIYIVENNKLKKVEIKTGIENLNETEIIETKLDENTKIVKNPSLDLKNNMKVNVIEN
ncbi:RND family efflux transporter MFP subunit [Hypnocyclicus thermotrophus]|uniref:RND family efflux transporter MFP subunit n=1 Tax=Hypnocyclicus thermotrophus TaxID=1627895 RepID=A0AA46I4R5_9FUSO|nr:efflux RND transporter periplasmic adaptor subunit [Hypnocyclicus thermotrophus]TDT67411.1 RND family efflux transporter MFP subunit [Hypnocyclicus thermotrophus]